MDARIDYGVKVCAKAGAIDPGSAGRGIGDCGTRDKAVRPNRTQLPNWRAIAGHDQCPSRSHFTKDSRGLVAKLSLRDCSSFHEAIVAFVALRSKT